MEVKWKPPDRTWYKLNYDGEIFRDSFEGGIGAIIRDQACNVIATLSQKIKTCYSEEIYG